MCSYVYRIKPLSYVKLGGQLSSLTVTKPISHKQQTFVYTTFQNGAAHIMRSRRWLSCINSTTLCYCGWFWFGELIHVPSFTSSSTLEVQWHVSFLFYISHLKQPITDTWSPLNQAVILYVNILLTTLNWRIFPFHHHIIFPN